MTDLEARAAILAEKHRRLRLAAEAVIADCRPVGDGKPMCKVPPHRIRTLRRELEHRPQPSGMWMSVQ